MKPALILVLIFLFSSTGSASSLDTAPDISEIARNNAKAILNAKPNRRLGYIANTNSMIPTFDSRHIVVMEPAPFERLEQDQIVVFNAAWSETPVVHRLYYHTRSGWLTKGDNLSRPDPSVLTKENYAGVVIVAAIHKKTGRVMTSL